MTDDVGPSDRPLSGAPFVESAAEGFASFSAPRQIAGVVIASCVVFAFLTLLVGTPVVVAGAPVLAGVLAFLEAWHAGIRKRKGSRSFLNISPMGWGIAFMGLLVVSYPVYFFSRNRLKTSPGNTTLWVLTNCSGLLVLVLGVSVFFAGPRRLLVATGLPSCTSPEVTRLVEQLIRNTPQGANVHSIDRYREISYDRETDRRVGECTLHTGSEEVTVQYVVEWLNRDKGQFVVRIPPPDLPGCTSREVVQLLERVIRGTPLGGKPKSIDGHHEVSYDQAADRRHGQCLVHTDGGDIVVDFLVQWRDRDKGQFEVRITNRKADWEPEPNASGTRGR